MLKKSEQSTTAAEGASAPDACNVTGCGAWYWRPTAAQASERTAVAVHVLSESTGKLFVI